MDTNCAPAGVRAAPLPLRSKTGKPISSSSIRKLIEADRFKIEMKQPYSPVYMRCIEEAKQDLQAKARPELTALPESIDGYDTVILAYPNYWGTMPMPGGSAEARPARHRLPRRPGGAGAEALAQGQRASVSRVTPGQRRRTTWNTSL